MHRRCCPRLWLSRAAFHCGLVPIHLLSAKNLFRPCFTHQTLFFRSDLCQFGVEHVWSLGVKHFLRFTVLRATTFLSHQKWNCAPLSISKEKFPQYLSSCLCLALSFSAMKRTARKSDEKVSLWDPALAE